MFFFFPQDFSLGLLHLPRRGGMAASRAWSESGPKSVRSWCEVGPEIGAKSEWKSGQNAPYHGGNAREGIGFELEIELEIELL